MYALPLDGPNFCGLKLAEAVWSDEDSVAGVDDTGLDHARHDRAYERNRKGIVDVELERCRTIVVAMVREDVEEHADQIKVVSCNVGDLEDGADPARYKLSSSIYALLSVLDEDGDFSRAWRLEDFSQLSDGLLENLRWTNVDFGNDHHNGDVECESDAKMFSEQGQLNDKMFIRICRTHLLMPTRPLLAATIRRQ